jgi:hypothetical protein
VEPRQSGAWARKGLNLATEFCNGAEGSALTVASHFDSSIFAPDICKMPNALFTGLPPTMQNLPLLKRPLLANGASPLELRLPLPVCSMVAESVLFASESNPGFQSDALALTARNLLFMGVGDQWNGKPG